MLHFLVISSVSVPVPHPPESVGSISSHPCRRIGTAVVLPTLDVRIGVVALAFLYFHAEHLAETFQQFLDATHILF